MNLPPLLRWLLWPLSLFYDAAVRLRAWLYARSILKQRRLQTPVISVGNLTVGGTGKTPMVIWLAERFLAQGKRVAILSRGYGGAAGTSDEIELMRYRLNDRVVFGVGKDRYAQARLLEPQGVDIFLLDDGYQHLRLARDVNILLMDAARPLGHEYLLPAGRLREPVSSMCRASLLVFTRAETLPDTAASIEKLQSYPVFSAATRLLGFRRLGGGVQILSLAEISSGPFYAFCGIGNPEAFFFDLRNWKLNVAGTRVFADHHRYSSADTLGIENDARSAGACALLTTEKDAQNLDNRSFPDTPAYIAVIDLDIPRDELFLAAIREQLDARTAAA